MVLEPQGPDSRHSVPFNFQRSLWSRPLPKELKVHGKVHMCSAHTGLFSMSQLTHSGLCLSLLADVLVFIAVPDTPDDYSDHIIVKKRTSLVFLLPTSLVNVTRSTCALRHKPVSLGTSWDIPSAMRRSCTKKTKEKVSLTDAAKCANMTDLHKQSAGDDEDGSEDADASKRSEQLICRGSKLSAVDVICTVALKGKARQQKREGNGKLQNMSFGETENGIGRYILDNIQ